MVEVGDRIVVYALPYKAIVIRLYWIDSNGVETTFDNLKAKQMAEIDWGEFGKSKVAICDENIVWFKYKENN